MKQDREAVRMLVQDVGYKEASSRLGISYATLRKWAERGKWNKPRVHSQAIVTTVTKPADAQLAILNERKHKSKLHLSSYVEKASHRASQLQGGALLKESGNVKNVASVHAGLWPEEEQGQGTVSGLRLYSKQTIVHVDQRDQLT